MTERIRDLKFIHFFLISLAAAFAVLCISGFAAYAGYSGKVRSGELVTYDIDLEECRFESIKEIEKGQYVATDPDSQIIFSAEGAVEAVEICMSTYIEPGEVLLFYNSAEGEDFTDGRMRWAHIWNAPDSYLFHLDGSQDKIAQIRIDPTVYAGNRVNIERIRINPELGLKDFLTFDQVFLFKTLLYSALVSVILRELFRKK